MIRTKSWVKISAKQAMRTTGSSSVVRLERLFSAQWVGMPMRMWVM